MMDMADIARQKAAAIVLNLLSSCQTDDQIRFMAALFAGRSAGEIAGMVLAVAPAEKDRTGILLPYLTAGSMTEFANRIHDPVCLLVAMYSTIEGAVPKVTGPMSFTVDSIPTFARKGPPDEKSIGSRTMSALTGEALPVGFSPGVLRRLGEQVSPASLWAAVGLLPSSLSLGLTGLNEVKGNIPASAAGPGRPRVFRDVPGSGADPLSRADADARDLLEKGQIP
jgi:hypothetical protein